MEVRFDISTFVDHAVALSMWPSSLGCYYVAFSMYATNTSFVNSTQICVEEELARVRGSAISITWCYIIYLFAIDTRSHSKASSKTVNVNTLPVCVSCLAVIWQVAHG